MLGCGGGRDARAGLGDAGGALAAQQGGEAQDQHHSQQDLQTCPHHLARETGIESFRKGGLKKVGKQILKNLKFYYTVYNNNCSGPCKPDSRCRLSKAHN